MSDDPLDDDLEAFLHKALEIQLADREEDLSEDRLKAIAERAGITGEDWKRLCEKLEATHERGQNFLRHGNCADAIPELEEAATLAPYRANVLSDCGRAHLLNWKETGAPESRGRAMELFQKCLQIDAGNSGAAQGIALLNSPSKWRWKLRRPGMPMIASAALAVSVVAVLAAIQFWREGGTGNQEVPNILAQESREYEGKRYLLVRIPMTRDEASEYCRKLGGRLVTIEDRAENRWLYDSFGAAMARDKKNAWIGASDAAEEGKWVWEDGSPVVFQKWAGSGPNDRGDEEGALMVATSDEWNDASVNKKWWFFCEWDSWPPQVSPDLDLKELGVFQKTGP